MADAFTCDTLAGDTSQQATGVAVVNFDGWPDRIVSRWRQSVEGIIETGRLISAAKAALPHGAFLAMIKTALPFKPRFAQMLMAIGEDERLTNAQYIALLPPSVGTMYDVLRLEGDEFEARISDGTIRPDMERAAAKAAVQEQRQRPAREAYESRVAEGCRVDDLHALAASGWRAGAILADPNWEFVARSAKGEGRSASQHYKTQALDAIKSLPVAQLGAADCILFLWMLDWCPMWAWEVIEAWGFKHKTTAFTWVKLIESGEINVDEFDRSFHFGQGYWTRANPEDCWLATRGNPKRIHADVRQLVIAPVMEHSHKPDVHDRIERLVGGPYLELFARRERPDWKTWGDEIPRTTFQGVAA